MGRSLRWKNRRTSEIVVSFFIVLLLRAAGPDSRWLCRGNNQGRSLGSLGFRDPYWRRIARDDVRRFLQRFVGENAESQLGPVAVYFARIERLDEGEDFPADDLPRHKDGKSRRIGNYKHRRHYLPAGSDVLLQVAQRHVLAQVLVVGHEIALAHIPFRCHRSAATAEETVEMTEVRQRGEALGQRLDLQLMQLPLGRAHVLVALV